MLRLSAGATTTTVVAGTGPASEAGYNADAALNAPFGITTDARTLRHPHGAPG